MDRKPSALYFEEETFLFQILVKAEQGKIPWRRKRRRRGEERERRQKVVFFFQKPSLDRSEMEKKV